MAQHPRAETVTASVELFRALTPTLLPATHTNSYAIGSREVLLIEPATPFEDEQREWLAWARGFASQGRKLLGIALTHHHEDHVGGAARFSRELALPLFAHPETAVRLALDSIVIERQLEDGARILLDGPVPETWEVLHTPGHAPGHLCFFEPNARTLILGDMMASVGTILIAPGDGHMATYLRELARLRELDAEIALPAHGDPIQTPRALFDHYIAHRLKREAKVLAALGTFGNAGASLGELVVVAYDDVPEEVHAIAELSLEKHLEKLVEEGKAAFARDSWRAVHGTTPA